MRSNIHRVKSGLHFHHHQPHEPVPGLEVRPRKLPVRDANGQLIDVANTRVDFASPLVSCDRLLDVPRMTTLAIGVLINELVRELPADTCFLNVGVWQGFSFFSALLGNEQAHCIGVDNFSQYGEPERQFLQRLDDWGTPRCEFHRMDYCEYFRERHRHRIGFFLYDGPHDFENQVRGLQLAHPFMVPDGLMLVDDTNWDAPREATMAFLESHPGQYEVAWDQRTCGNGHPTFWNGFMLLVRNKDY